MSRLLKKSALLIVASIVFLVMIGFGIWQLDRAEQKLVVQQQLLARQDRLIDLNQNPSVDAGMQFSQAVASGQYLPQHTILLDSQVSDGQVGYHVLTPFAVAGSGIVVLVNRGWIPAGQSRERKPEIDTPEGVLQIQGRLNKPPSKPLLWDDSVPLIQGGAWQYLDLAGYQRHSGVAVLPVLLELDKTLDDVGGYVRQWRAYNDSWVSRHRGYAVQWFAMAVAFLILCVVVLRKSRR